MSGDDLSAGVAQVIAGAWREALGESGFKRVVLFSIVAFITIPFAPFWALLWVLEKAGVYRVPK